MIVPVLIKFGFEMTSLVGGFGSGVFAAFAMRDEMEGGGIVDGA